MSRLMVPGDRSKLHVDDLNAQPTDGASNVDNNCNGQHHQLEA